MTTTRHVDSKARDWKVGKGKSQKMAGFPEWLWSPVFGASPAAFVDGVVAIDVSS